jgi:AraC-like DNA-binding protein
MAEPQTRFDVMPAILEGVVTVKAESARHFGRHTHDDFGIGLMDAGAQASSSGRGPVEAGPGNVITVNPGEVHDGRPIGGRGRRWRMLYVAPSVMADAVRDVLEGHEGSFDFCDPVIGDAQTVADVAALLATMTAGERDAMAAESGLLTLIGHLTVNDLAGHHRVGRYREPSAACGRATRARQRIDDDPASAMTLGTLASEAGLSRFQLLRAFARETGLPAHAYILQKRVSLARRLITTGMPLAQAAAQAGFSDQSHMSRVFVRSFGFTPGALAISFKTPRRLL